MARLRKLALNHLDAWGLTFIIGALVLVVHQTYTIEAVLLVLAVSTGYWLGFAVNDYFDAPHDAQDEQKGASNYFVGLRHRRRAAALVLGLPLLFVIAVFAMFGWSGIIAVTFSLAIAYAYSAPPLRLKRRPIFDLLTHAIFVETYPYVVCLVLLQLTPSLLDAVLIAGFFLASLSAQLEQQARDYELDKRTEGNFTTWAGVKTTAWLLRTTTALLMLLMVGAFLSGIIPPELAPFGFIVSPLLIHRFLRDVQQPRSAWLTYFTVLAGAAYTGILLLGTR